MNRHSHAPFAVASAMLVLIVLASGCKSSKAKTGPDTLPYDPHWSQPDAPQPIGKLLADVDASLRAWTKLVMSARSAEEKRAAQGLELDLSRRVHPRTAELITQLESGPPANRIPAAAALGFSHAPEAQSPLLNALHDSNVDVVNNALIGLAILDLKDTPLGPIQEIYANNPDGRVRSNAAWAARTLMENGADGSALRDTARLALADSEPFVRAQSALILAQLEDADSITQLGELAQESTAFVSLAAGEALAVIGKANPHQKGPTARALAIAYGKLDKKERPVILRALLKLSEQNLGEDPKDWLEWAYKLP